MRYFILDQLKKIHNGGMPVLIKKLGIIALIPTALLAVIFIRLLRPFKTVRFGRLESTRIGHFAMDIEIYLCERRAGLHDKFSFDIFYYGCDRFCNYQIKKMCERTVRIWSFAKYVDKINRFFPQAKRHIITTSFSRDIHGSLDRFENNFSFTCEEEEQGQMQAGKIGLSPGVPFVCFSARDPVYLNTVLKEKGSWQNHDYRDSDICNYLPAVRALVKKGYFAVRMGHFPGKALPESEKIIDYASKHRTDFLDIYLGSKCAFFICDTAGIYAIPAVFRRPIAWVNFIPLEYIHGWGKNYLSIPKKLWLKEKKRFLTFREIIDSKIGRFLNSEEYKKSGIEVIENTPEEIAGLTEEMDQRLKGLWEEDQEDKELQKRFWALFKPGELNKVFISRIGAQFLRENKELVE